MEMIRIPIAQSLLCLVLTGLILCSFPSRTSAAEIKILSAGAVTEVMTRFSKDFQAETGHTFNFTFQPVGTILSLMAGGETGDIIILTDKAIDDLGKKGLIVSQSVVEIGKTGIGVAVKEGTPLPDISTTEALRQTLINAKSLVYADPAKGASSGIYFANLLQRLGIAEAVKEKTFLRPGGYVVELVAEGKAEIGIHQITEILPVKGITLVGPLPAEVQNITTYAAGISPTAKQPEIAKQFLDFVKRPDNTHLFKELGFGTY
jgi:molybdate transport system substrate-binding protein